MKYFFIIFTFLLSLSVFGAGGTGTIQADNIKPSVLGNAVNVPNLQVDNVNVDANTVKSISGDLVLDAASTLKASKDVVPNSSTLNLGSSGSPWQNLYTSGEAFGLKIENVTSGTMPTSDPLKKGRLVYTTDTKKLYVDDGTAFILASGAGGGISEWVTTNTYVANDIVHINNKIYKCLIGHTAGTFATDLAASKWVELANDPSTEILTGFSSAAGTISATDSVLQAIQKLDGNDGLKVDKSTLTTKGDIYIATGAGAVVRQGAGTNNQVFTADSAQANGAKWADPQISTKGQNEVSSTLATEIQVPNNQLTTTATGKRLVETGNRNMLINPSMEGSNTSGVADGWTNSSTNSTPSITTATSEVTHGLQAQKIVLASGVLNFSTYIATSSGIQKQGYVLATYAAPSTWADFQVCSTVDGAEQTCVPNSKLILDGAYHEIKIPIVFGSINAGVKYKTTSAVSGTFLGDLSEVSQGLDLKNVTVDSDPIAWTPTITGAGTVTNLSCSYVRSGGDAIGSCVFTSGTVTATLFSLTLPSGLSLDSNRLLKSNNTSAAGQLVGGYFGNASSNAGAVVTAPLTSLTNLYFGYYATGGANLTPSTGSATLTSSQTVSLNFRIPILGWSSNSATYSEANSDSGWVPCTFSTLAWQGLGTVTSSLLCSKQGATLKMRGRLDIGTVAAAQAQFLLPNNWGAITTKSTVSINSPGGYLHRAAASTGIFVTSILQPSANYFQVSSSLVAAANSPTTPVNGSAMFNNNDTILFPEISIPIQEWTATGVIYGNFDTPSVSYNTASGQSTSTGTIIDFNTVEYDSCNPACVTTGASWKFTAPRPGAYQMCVALQWVSNAYNASTWEVNILKNGSAVPGSNAGFYQHINGTTRSPSTYGCKTVRLLKGDYIQAQSYETNGGPASLTSTGQYNHITVTRVGN